MAGFFLCRIFANCGVNQQQQQQTSSSNPLWRMRLKRKTSKDKKLLAICRTNEQLKTRNEKPLNGIRHNFPKV
jgi:hypothetical protein